MERTLAAYADEQIVSYFERVKRDGLTEHGFPRMAANIGILIAHGRRKDLMPLFLDMMDFCCEQIPRVKAANDFSVREIVCALMEIEAAGAVPAERLAAWKRDIIPERLESGSVSSVRIRTSFSSLLCASEVRGDTVERV